MTWIMFIILLLCMPSVSPATTQLKRIADILEKIERKMK